VQREVLVTEHGDGDVTDEAKEALKEGVERTKDRIQEMKKLLVEMHLSCISTIKELEKYWIDNIP
jgi:hypothetical protein